MRDKTRYPERYQPREESPIYAQYKPQPPRDLGKSCDPILPPREGTVIACIGHQHYFVDQDFVLVNEEKVSYMIWTRDSWAFFEPPPWVSGSNYVLAEDIRMTLEARREQG